MRRGVIQKVVMDGQTKTKLIGSFASKFNSLKIILFLLYIRELLLLALLNT